MADLLCHGTGRLFPHREGADLFADDAAEMDYIHRVRIADANLRNAGFALVESSNAWIKDGVLVTLEQVLHEGIAEVLTKHAEVVRTLSATPGS